MGGKHKVHIIMLGESAVGKTALLVRFCEGRFKEGFDITLGAEIYSKTIILRNTEVLLELWDTAGQEKFQGLIKKYFRVADGVLLMYDMTNHGTFMKLSSWLSQIRKHNEEASVLIVGNKSDLRHLNQVSATTVENFARDEGLDFYETSAKDNENVDEVFEDLVLKVLERKKILPVSEDSRDSDTERERSSNMVSVGIQTDDFLPPVIRLENWPGVKLEQNKSCC